MEFDKIKSIISEVLSIDADGITDYYGNRGRV